MSTLRESAQQALEALEAWKDAAPSQWTTRDEKAITALRAALAQQEQAVRDALTTGTGVLLGGERIDPASMYKQQEQANYPEEKLQAVAEYISNQYHVWYGVAARDVEEVLRQSVRCGLVNNPPRREWRSLSEEEIKAIHLELCKTVGSYYRTVARAIEQALKEKNYG